MVPFRRLSGPFAIAAAALLASCGGGGGDDGGGSSPSTSRCSGVEAFTYADAAAVPGKAAGAAVGGCSAALSDVSWTQTGGVPVTFLSGRTPAISFEPTAAGSYQFSVTYRVGSAAARSDAVTVVVAAPASTPASTVTVRADQAVRKGGNTSLRAWPTLAAGDSIRAIAWTQLEGPTVTLTATSDGAGVTFTAPEVSNDTLLRFRATLTTTGGRSDSDEVLVLVENVAQAPSASNPHVFSDMHVSRVHAYKAEGAYAGVLAACTYDPGLQWTGSGKNLCPLSTLPFLHQTTGDGLPTVAQIMDRVLVSHDWMGAAFENFLSGYASDDQKRLFNGVTAIVIGAHVRPSFYYSATGAIYLDADNFWLTAAQRDVIDEVPDYRSDYGSDLQFAALWRYTQSNQSIFYAFPATSRLSRPLGYLQQEAGWLLYHELAHASDFMPPARRASVNTAQSAWDNIATLYAAGQLPSDALTLAYPLQSAEMRALANVLYVSGPASSGSTLINGIPYSTLTGYTATQVGGFFSADRASDVYNYSSTREDIAMLFEEFMQVRNHGFRRDVAITDPILATSTGSTLAVRWGQRGRVGDAALKPRVQQAVAALAPWVLTADPNAVTNLAAPLAMRSGDSWTGNLCLPTACTGASPLEKQLSVDAQLLLALDLRRPGRLPALGAAQDRPNERLLKYLATH